MATTLKTLTPNDIKAVQTRLHEVIPITGSVVSGTYTSDANIQKYTHGMFQSVYDYPYLSSSANHIFDLTVGVWPSGDFGVSGSRPVTSSADDDEKRNIYSQMAQVLMGHDKTGSILPFNHDGLNESTKQMHSCIIMPLTRLLVKDEIEKETFKLILATASTWELSSSHPASSSLVGIFEEKLTIKDLNAKTNYFTNSPAGDYAILYKEGDTSFLGKVGLIFYQAGVVVLDPSGSGLIADTDNEAPVIWDNSTTVFSASQHETFDWEEAVQSSSIDQICDGVRRRIYDMEFRNTTELNSTVYFVRANHNEFNYSSNPTYITGSKIRVKNDNKLNAPTTYITTIGLHAPDGETLAVAKLSEPLKKNPDTELTIRVRLDY